MRWMGVVVLLSSSCLRQEEAPEAIDASVMGVPEDAGAPFDPCVWNGRSGYCYAVTGFVFSGDGCMPVCAPKAGTSGTVFKTNYECQATCSCRREKFEATDSPSDPFVIGGGCDEVWAITDGGVDLSEWFSCVAPLESQRCRLDLAREFTLGDLGIICEVSALPQVRSVVCVVEAH